MSKIKQVRSGRFTQISNVIFEDTRLSYKEIGIYCNMLKFPDDWEFSLRYLAECHKDKKASVKSGLDKLLDYGYISRDENQTRNEKGMFSNYDYIIYQDPFDNPNYIPCPGKKITQLDQKPLSEYWPAMITEFENHPTDGTEAENRHTDNTVSENQHTDETEAENRFTGNPLTDYPFTGNQPQTNTVYTNTFYTNTVLTNNEEDEDNAHANLNIFIQKLMNIYMCYYYSSCNNPKAQKEMMQAFNAIINAISVINDQKIIDAINSCSKEEAEKIWLDVYNDMFSTRLGNIVRNDIRDRHAYLVKYITNQIMTCHGNDPLLYYEVRQ